MNKANSIINQFLLGGDKFMPELHLVDPIVKKYSACGTFTKHTQRIQDFLNTGKLSYIYKNDLDKACFQHDTAYNKFKDLEKRTQSDIVLKNKAFKIASNPKYNGHERGLASMIFKFFDKKSKGSGLKENQGNLLANSQLADELHKPIIRKFNKRKVYSYFKDNIWSVDLADTQLISKYNKGIRYLLCGIDLFSKYAWVVPLKDKKGVSIFNAFQSIFKKCNRKPNKIWVDQGSEFYNNVFKKWLKDNGISMYSTYNQGKSVVAERFIRTLKNKIYKHMTAISENVYFDVLDDIVDEYNNTYRKTIKMKLINVKNDSFAEYNEKSNEKDPKFKVDDHVKISKFKNVFAKGYTPNWSEEIFIVKKIKKYCALDIYN